MYIRATGFGDTLNISMKLLIDIHVGFEWIGIAKPHLLTYAVSGLPQTLFCCLFL